MDPQSEIPIADQTVQLEKMKGKGGWTFAVLNASADGKKNNFGWRKVRGFIDDYELNDFNLMPLSNGRLFLPVKAEIRKKINKHEGDWVKIVLYLADKAAPVKDEDLLICLEEEPEAMKNFNSFTDTEQKRYLDWIAGAGTDDQKVDRIAQAITRIAEGRYLWK